ncbi:hypothetical protein K7H20_22465 [Salipiger manganoxidans]|uniref:hypothetical protein n=1 Tax=Salipiger marinus TaxID=555512 RepID=UPI001E579275|nr:hypothetical protein [Salipiger manganoxidans]MCD1620826.1 hypothetical protein [Salipiger manganoxidans]
MNALRWRWVAAALLLTTIFNAIQHYAGYPALDYWHAFLRSVSAVLVWEAAKLAVGIRP